MKRQTFVVVMAVLILTSAMAPFATVAGARGGPPAGMVGVPGERIEDIRASGVERKITAGDLDGAVYTSKHAGTTEVSLVTTEQAAEVAAGASPSDIAGRKVCSGPAAGKNPSAGCDYGMALVISDDVHHEGRRIAIKTSVVKDALGYVPQSLSVANNETGETWRAPARIEDGWLVADVPHFSSNSVTWDGTFEYSATPATNGTTVTYDLSDVDSVSDFTINVTGSTNRANESVSQVVGDGGSFSVPVDGTTAPTEATVTLAVEWLQAWGFTGSGYGYRSAAAGDSTVYGGNDNGNLYAVYEGNGTEKWMYSGTGRVWGLEADGSYVYMGDEGPSVQKLAASDGTQQWSYTGHTGKVRAVAVSDDSGSVYSASEDTEVHSLAASDGTQNWNYTGFSTNVVAVGAGGGTVVAGDKDGAVHGIAGSDGTQQWTYTAPTDGVAGIAVENGTAYAATKGTGETLHAINASDGSQLWTASLSGDALSVEVYSGVVYVGVDGSGVVAFDASDGTKLFTESTTSSNRPQVAIRNDRAYVADFDANLVRQDMPVDPSLTVDGNTVSVTGLFDSPSHQEAVSLSLGDHTASASMTQGQVSATVEFEEVTESENPRILVNGNETSYSGTLADGETTSLTANESWLVNGTNTIDVYVSESVSSSAPTPQLDVQYSHVAVHDQNVSYEAEQWTSRYNVSKTYASERTQAGLNISHTTEVVAIRDLEYRINESGGWTTATSGEYTLSGNDLTVDLDAVYGGTVPASTTFEIRSNASKVETHNVSIEVLEATPVGDKLNSKIQIKSISGGAYIGVGPTSNGDRVHHLTDESWSSPSEYVIIGSDGSQNLHFPNAGASDTAYVTHLPTDVSPKTGDVKVAVVRGGSSPKMEIGPGPAGGGDEVNFTHYDTTSGTKYILHSVSEGVQRDHDVAESPVYLTDDDSSETLVIKTEDSGGGGGDGGGIPYFPDSDTGGFDIPLGSLWPEAGILAGAVLFLGGAYRFASSRSSAPRTTGSAEGATRTQRAARSAKGLGSRLIWLIGRLTAAVVRVVKFALGALKPAWGAFLRFGNTLLASRAGRYLAIGATVFVVLNSGALNLTQSTQTIIIVASLLLAAYLVLQKTGQFSFPLYSLITAVTVVLALNAMGSDFLTATVQSPAFSIVAVGGIIIAYMLVDAWREGETTNVTIRADGGGDEGK